MKPRLRVSTRCPTCNQEARGYVSTVDWATTCQNCQTRFETLWPANSPRRFVTAAQDAAKESLDSACL